MINDIRFALRMLAKNPGFTALALLALVLGIGANTAMFSVVNAVLLRPLPFRDAGRLVMVWERSPRTGENNVVNPQNFKQWESRNHSFERMAAYIAFPMSLTGDGRPEEVSGAYITREFFSILDITPVRGRDFLPEENVRGRSSVAVISHGLWERRYGSDTGILGRKIQLHGDPVTIVGVLPSGFRFPDMNADVFELYVPRIDVAPIGRFLSVIARLKPGITIEQARDDMRGLAAQIEKEQPVFDAQWGATAVGMQDEFAGSLRTPLLVLLGSVGLVLLIAYANVANLMLIRAGGRQREMALRVSLGATRLRIARQLLMESAILGLAGGVLGLVLAVWVKNALLALLPENMSVAKVNQVAIDQNVLWFTLIVSLLTSLLFGLVPAMRGSQIDLAESLKEGARTASGSVSRNRMRTMLAASEIALALMLLIGAGLLMKSLLRLQQVQPGFRPEHVLTMRAALNGPRYAQRQKQVEGWNEIIERIQKLPGVIAAGSIQFPPLSQMFSATGFWVDGQPVPKPGNEPVCAVSIITSDLLRAMGIPLLQGRAFGVQDREGSPQVTLVNETLARRFFPDRNPIGHRLFVQWGRTTPYEIVGVVADVRQKTLDTPVMPTVYFPDAQETNGGGTLVIRSTGDPMLLAQLAQDTIHAYDRDLALADIRPMSELVSETLTRPRFQSTLLGVFAGLAVFLASIGVFGVMAYSVTQRVPEIGIRLALGAQTGAILRMILREGLVVALIGVVIGLAGALALTRFLRTLLFEVSPTDVATFLVVPFLITGVALLAAWWPARRAARVEAMEALRYE